MDSAGVSAEALVDCVMAAGGPASDRWQSAYRDAKIRTLAETAAKVLGPSGRLPAVRLVDEAFLAGVERGDFGTGWDTGAVARDAEWIPGREWAERSSYRGREGFVEFMHSWTEDFEGLSRQLENLVDAGSDRVLGTFRQFANGRASGAPVEQEFFVLHELEGRQIVRFRVYLDRGQAFEAAGLQE